MNVNRRWSGIDVVRIRVLVAGLALLAVGGIALGRSTRLFQPGQATLDQISRGQNAGVASNPALPSRNSSQKLGAAALTAFNHLPMMFEPNVGQTTSSKSDPAVKFVARGSGYGLFLTSEGAVMSLRSRSSKAESRFEALSMKFVGANPNASVTGADLLPGKTNYYIGGDPAKWHSGVAQFARVRYENVYPGVNLVFYGNQGQLEYDFQIAPGANAAQPELEFDGSKHLQLSKGNLIVRGQGGSVRLEAPHVYQQIDGHEQTIEGHFELRAENRVGFAIGPYDHTRELTIDPKLNYSTYFGGSGDETCPSPEGSTTGTPGCPAIAVDNGGNIYLTGATTSSIASFPQPAGNPTQLGTPNIYVAEISTTGGPQGLLYLTFLGGGGTDVPTGIAVDGGGNAYIAGTTSSGINGAADFPVTVSTAYQTTVKANSTGAWHVFVTVLAAGTGALGNYSSYLSGSGTDIASGVAIDSNQDVFITGTTTSTNTSDAGTSQNQFPVSNLPQALPLQSLPRAAKQFFMTKVNTAAPKSASIAYSTYFGGNTFNTTDPIVIGGGITVDSTGNVFFTGTTNFTFLGCNGCQNTDFPILNAYQPCLDQQPPVTIVTPVTCTYSTPPTASDAFVAKLNPNAAQGQQLIWSTYFGGTDTDTGVGVAVDTGAANVYITGSTNSPDVTTSANTTAFQSFQVCLNVYPNPATLPCPAPTSATDAYVARLSNPTTTTMSLNYFSYLGGSGNDAGQGIVVDNANGALITGWTQSADFPVVPNPNTIQGALKGPQDAFLTRINTVATTGQNTTGSYSSYFGGSGTEQGTSIALDTKLNTYFAGTTNSTDLQTTGSLALQAANHGGYDAFAVQLGTAADLGISGILSLANGQTYVSAGSQATFIYTVTNGGPDLATNITVTDDLTGTGVPLTFVSATASSGTCSSATSGSNPSVVCNIPSLQSGSTATVTIVLIPTAAGNFNGGNVSVTSVNNNDPNPGNDNTRKTGQASDFSVQVNPANQSIPAAGDTASYTVLLQPLPLYNASISLSCAKLPNASACTFTPTSVTLNSSSQGSTALNISTTARPISAAGLMHRSRGFYATWLALPGMALFGLGIGGRRSRKKIFGALMLCALFAILVLQPACKSSKTTTVASGTPPGTYTITVTATSGSLSHSSSITLTVP